MCEHVITSFTMINLTVDPTSTREKLESILNHSGAMILSNLASVGEFHQYIYMMKSKNSLKPPHRIQKFRFIGDGLNHIMSNSDIYIYMVAKSWFLHKPLAYI